MATLLEARDWDFVVGSVHFVGEHAVDHDGYEVWDHRSQRPDALWRRYFETLGEAARIGLFDILAHPDLVKLWGARRPVPEGDLRRFYDLAMDGIAESQHRRRGLDGRAAQAGRRAVPGAGVPGDVPRRGLPGRAVQRRARARRRRARLRARRSSCSSASASASSRSSSAASGGWRRSDERGVRDRASAGTRTASRPGAPLILGGVEFDGAELGLDGHSDADVLTHAVMDALLGAAGLDDIGVHFPDTDGAYEDADSIELLREVRRDAARRRAWRIVHVDTTVLMERPKVGPHRDAIRARLADGARARARGASTSRRRPARGWASSAAARASPRSPSRRVEPQEPSGLRRAPARGAALGGRGGGPARARPGA